ASGGSTGGYDWGGSAGGSVWLDVGVLSGSGNIQANGGHAGNYGGGGGGGRIAIDYNSLSGFDLQSQMVAVGGQGKNGRPVGSAGTIYLKTKGASLGELRLDNGAHPTSSAATELSGDWPESVHVNNNLLRLEEGSRLSEILGSGSSVRVEMVGSISELPGQGLIVEGATMTVQTMQGHFTHLILRNGTVLTHSTGQIGGLQLDVGTVEIDGTSKIDVVGKGLGRLAGLEDSNPSLHRNGASHGGLGGIAYGGTTNPTYGDARAPTELGAGNDKRGGGAIKLVADSLSLDGQIMASGGSTGGYDWGGSAGGSVWLDVGVLSGSGNIQANGGHAGNYGGGGG
ncbi:MAG: hypothetical protein GY797_34935, partial [Deltaproteobacteria bacterium]|nr:hypothetical protein [Deltaproteobacteria bacterium]